MSTDYEITIYLSGDGQKDGDKIVQQLDGQTSDIVPIERYGDYLRSIAACLRERARQVDDEVG